VSALVGLIGKKRSGKDSFAAVLVEESGFRRFAFADPLKDAVLRLPVPVYDTVTDRPRYRCLQDVVREHGWEGAKEIRAVRRLLQEYGVAIREIQEDFWVRATLDRAVQHSHESGPSVVTDVRFPNEAEEVRDAGGVIVRVSRPGLVSTDTHASETALDDFEPDLEVVNGGTLEDLAWNARRFARSSYVVG
jgi:hypothetical protein